MYSVSNTVMLYVSICADYKKKRIMEFFLKILLFSLTNPSFGFAGEGCIAFWKIFAFPEMCLNVIQSNDLDSFIAIVR